MGEAGSSGGWVGTILRVGAAPAVLVGLIAWVVAPRWGEVVERGGLPSTAVVVAVVVANVVANGGLAWMWVALVRAGSTDVDVRAAVRAHAVSLPARYVAPGGHVPARAAAARRHGLSVTAGVGLGGVELVLSVLVLSLVSLATMPGWVAVEGAGRTAWLAVLPAAAALALLVAPTPTMTAAARAARTLARLLPSGAVDRLAIPADGGGTGTGHRRGRLVRGVALRYLGVLGVRSLGFVVLGTAVVGHVDAHVVTALLGGFAVSNLVGRVVVIAPAGLGVREAMLLAVLAPTLGIGPAGVTAVAARLLDAAAEAVFVGLALLWRDPRAGGALEGDAVLVLPDATAVLVGMVHERTWSRVAEGKQGAQRVWCKQHLDRRRRPDPAGARAQAAAARRAAGVGLPAVPPLALLEECAVTVHPWVDVEPPGSGLPTLVGRLALGQVDGTGSAPLFGVDAVMAGVAGPVLLDLPDLSGSPEQQAGELVASALRIRWGRPLRGFVAGPDWPLAVAVLAELAVCPSTDVVRHRQLEWWSDRRGEWVGRTGRDAATRWLGVHTLGVAYHRRILHGLAAGRLSPTPDGPVPASGTVEVIR